MRGLASGFVSAATLLAYTPPAPSAAAPLNMGKKVWSPAPPGQVQGQCMVLPNSNAMGEDVQQILNTTAEACCSACAAEPRCAIWNFCPDPAG